MRALPLWTVFLLLPACTEGGAEEQRPESKEEPVPCGHGDRAITGCGERCPAGELALEDGSCIPAGVPAERCGEGFVAEEGGCRAILAAGCGFGTIAVPGDEICRPIDDCGSGTWGNIPSDGTVIYVDAAAGTGGTGTASAPFSTITAALASAPAGARIAVAAGTYAEDLVVAKTVAIQGRCAEMVEIAGVSEIGAVFFQQEASLSDVSVTGPQIGVLLSGALNVVLERVHIHDTGWRGLDLENVLGPTSGRLVDSLVEGASENGVFSLGSDLVVERSVVRGTKPAASGDARGVNVQSDIPGQVPSNVSLLRSVVENNPDVGIRVWGANLSVSESVIRDTAPSASGEFGRAIDAYTDPASRANVTVTSSVIERATTTGIHVEGDAVIDATTIRDVAHEPFTNAFGRCLAASDAPGAARTTLALSHSLLERCVGGLMLDGDAEAVVAGLLVRDMIDGGVERARGIQIQGTTDGIRASAQIYGSVVARTQEAGMVVTGADALVDGLHVHDIEGAGIIVQTELPPLGSATVVGSRIERTVGMGAVAIGGALTFESSAVVDTFTDATERFSRGLGVQWSLVSQERGQLAVRDSLVAGSREGGVIVMGSDLVVEDSTIRDTTALPGGNLGDGVAVSAIIIADLIPASAQVSGLQVFDSERAGLSAFSADVEVADSTFTCQGFDFNAESYGEYEHGLVDGGGNRCGCPELSDQCKAVSAGLGPPEPLGEL